MAGVYVFFVNVQSFVDQSIYVYVVLNGVTKVRTMAYCPTDYVSNIAGPNLAVLSVNTGDRVWVNHRYSYDGPVTMF